MASPPPGEDKFTHDLAIKLSRADPRLDTVLNLLCTVGIYSVQLLVDAAKADNHETFFRDHAKIPPFQYAILMEQIDKLGE